MIKDVEMFIDEYWRWLKNKTVLREVDGHVEITTPFIDRHNDFVQIYARRKEGGYVLTDGGYTIDDLAMSGCPLDKPKRQELLKITLAGFGVKEEKGALVVDAMEKDFCLKKHNLVQAILAVNDLFYVAKPYVKSLFLEDVAAWLDGIEVRYMSKVKFSGRSGYDHVFDFAIPKSKSAPERLVRAINNPAKDSIQAVAFCWLDTREARPAGSVAYAILNDDERKVPDAVDGALRGYEIMPALWSKRDELRDALAA